jgi:serine/threonine protein kinase
MQVGTRLGAYEVTAKLGEGGMGEVYRARDLRLKRDVALKLLPASYAADPDRLARFQREAEVLAALNHPHIAQLYGLEDVAAAPGEAAAPQALVMELVEGEDLSAIIARGPLPQPEALAVARQIAEALEAAHEQGIIHRDLGAVKVLDFGLATAFDPAAWHSGSATNSPTISMHATQAGIILGTAAYVAPEQARPVPQGQRASPASISVILNWPALLKK